MLQAAFTLPPTSLIGRTPLLELTHIEKAEGLQARILVKLEYFNPAGNVTSPTII